jgi:hypothetical protein
MLLHKQSSGQDDLLLSSCSRMEPGGQGEAALRTRKCASLKFILCDILYSSVVAYSFQLHRSVGHTIINGKIVFVAFDLSRGVVKDIHLKIRVV